MDRLHPSSYLFTHISPLLLLAPTSVSTFWQLGLLKRWYPTTELCDITTQQTLIWISPTWKLKFYIFVSFQECDYTIFSKYKYSTRSFYYVIKVLEAICNEYIKNNQCIMYYGTFSVFLHLSGKFMGLVIKKVLGKIPLNIHIWRLLHVVSNAMGPFLKVTDPE
jgi:hypothetical protein